MWVGGEGRGGKEGGGEMEKVVGEGMREGRGRGGYNNRVLIDGNESNSMFSTTETDCVV